MKLNRRNFFQAGATGVGMSMLPFSRAHGDSLETHFLLQIYIPGGWDTSYMFDARPRSMTNAGLIQNYSENDPIVIEGVNGQKTLANPLVQPLLSHFDAFSILNGVLMSHGFDGHDQNANFMMTGNPFGGNSFFPAISQNASAPLDSFSLGSPFTRIAIKNNSGTISLDHETAKSLSKSLTNNVDQNANAAQSFVSDSLQRLANQSRTGLLSVGASRMERGIIESKNLGDRLRQATFSQPQDRLGGQLEIIGNYLNLGIANTGLLILTPEGEIDTHDAESAKLQPVTSREIISKLASIFSYLKATKFSGSDSLSLLDLTTVVITSEFSRTMRQSDNAIDDTGTDHNPLANTVLVGGKGIKPRMIIGETDCQSLEEEVSPAHRSFDRSKVKLMGRPIDFATAIPRSDARPETLKPAHYLNYTSVANTLMKLFQLSDTSERWLLERNGDAAPTVDVLLR
jgi:uncharacterized protein (DUF1501 family)